MALAWLLVAAAVAVAAWAVALGLRDGGTTQDTWLFVVAAGSVTTAAVGALIGGKTGNATGWLLAVGGVGLGVGVLLGQAASGCGEPAALTAIPATFSATPGWQVAGSVAGVAVWGACLVTAVTFYPFGPSRMRDGWAAERQSLVAPALAWTGAVVATVAASAADGRVAPFGATSDRLCGTPFPGTTRPPALTAGVVLLALGAAAALAIAWRRERAVSGSDRAQLLPVVATATVAALALAATLLITEPGPLWGDSWPFVVAWALAAVALPLAVAVTIVRSHAFGIYRFVGFMADYRIWTAALGVGAIAAVLGLTWLIAWILGVDDLPVAVAAVALAMGAAVYPSWRGWQARVDARYGQHQEDPAETLERLTAEVDDPAQVRGPVFDLLARVAPMVVVQGEAGMRFLVSTDDREVGRHTFVHGGYDLGTMRCAMDLLAASRGVVPGIVLAGGAVLDIGANIGTSVVPLLRLFGADRGIAVEPAPGNVELLLLNIELNDLAGRVDVIPVGASDRDGFLELALSAENSGDHRMRVGTDDVFERSSVTVQVHRVDTLVETGALDPSDLTLVWLDVQGHEGHVLSGATSILRGSVPLVSEFWPSEMRRTGGLLAFTDAVSEHFGRMIDLRRTQDEGATVDAPASEIATWTQRYEDEGAFTDLLLLP